MTLDIWEGALCPARITLAPAQRNHSHHNPNEGMRRGQEDPGKLDLKTSGPESGKHGNCQSDRNQAGERKLQGGFRARSLVLGEYDACLYCIRNRKNRDLLTPPPPQTIKPVDHMGGGGALGTLKHAATQSTHGFRALPWRPPRGLRVFNTITKKMHLTNGVPKCRLFSSGTLTD